MTTTWRHTTKLWSSESNSHCSRSLFWSPQRSYRGYISTNCRAIWKRSDVAGLQITLTTAEEDVKASQACALWNAAASSAGLDPRHQCQMEVALANSYAMAAAFAPHGAVPLMRPCRLSSEFVDPSSQQMIGFARVISDGAFAALLTDVVVHPDFRMQGIGKGLVTMLMKKCIRKGASGCVVFAPRERMFFWKCGFRWSSRYRVMSLPDKMQSTERQLR